MTQGHATNGWTIGMWAGLAGLAMALVGSIMLWAAEGAGIFTGALVTSFLNCF
jgi:hypothetical protein